MTDAAKCKLRIELNETEREEWWADVAITFLVDAQKNLTIRAEWGDMDELYGDGCSITIPPRVWALAATWIAEHINA